MTTPTAMHSHRIREFWFQVQLKEAKGHNRHDADYSSEGDGQPDRGLGQRVLCITLGKELIQ